MAKKRIKKRVNRRKAILESAARLFVAKGYKNATMEEIVEGASTSVGNCYFYFSNKEALLKTVIKEILTRILNEVDERTKGIEEWHDRLAIELYSIITTSVKHGNFVELMLTSTPEIRHFTLNIFKERLEESFNIPEITEKYDLDLVVNSWVGTSMCILEKSLAGQLDKEPEEVGKFLVKWNLQALGLPQEVVEKALSSLDNIREISVDEKGNI